MAFRQVVVNSSVKLELKLNYLVCRGEKNIKIHISEISTLIVQSTAVSLTAALLCELIKNNVKVIFCDEKCSPHSELLPYYGSYNGSKRIRKQTEWEQEVKDKVWTMVIKRKIIEQANVLYSLDKYQEAEKMIAYAEEVTVGDLTNREGHAAKLYFSTLFGNGFTRGVVDKTNRCLNYGYAVLLSAFNRAIVAQGYLTQLGIWHKNEYNNFNLSCDLMEPFRPLIDRITIRLAEKDDFKKELVNALNVKAAINGQQTTTENAINIYVRSVINALNDGETDNIAFVDGYEL